MQGANPIDRSSLPEGNKQIFILSQNVSVIQKEDLAWGSYVLLRNTNTMSVVSFRLLVCFIYSCRGYITCTPTYTQEMWLFVDTGSQTNSDEQQLDVSNIREEILGS